MRLRYVWAATLVLLASAFTAAFAQNLFPTPVFTDPVQTGNSGNQLLPEPILPVLPALGSGFAPVPIFNQGFGGRIQCMQQVVYNSNNNGKAGEFAMMGYQTAPFGRTNEGEQVTACTLTNANGLKAVVLNFGGVLYSMETPDRDGKLANISCNLSTVAEYQKFRPYFGSLVGRYGNRIARGKFTLDGVEYQVPVNDGVNALHGGLRGFDQRIWNLEPFMTKSGVGVRLTYTAKDGEEGYPGNLTVEVRYILSNDNALTIDYTATCDKATPLNLTNHTFWNLGGAQSGLILDHILKLGASNYLPTDDGLIPTGEIAPVDSTPLDFRTSKPIGRDIAQITDPWFRGGFDHCLVLDKANEGELSFCAFVADPKSGRTMEIETTEPAVQFYSGNWLDGTTGVGDYKYKQHTAFCLEAQHYPDSPNQPAFPNTILRPGETYRQTTVHKFGIQ
ncbi:MAG: galactose mutarotase [Thermoguttaceae bacterium]|nr:galactose mutarotase [Thermoguttaceae bacterium]